MTAARNGSDSLKVLIFVEGSPLPFLGMEEDCRTFKQPKTAVPAETPIRPEEEIALPAPEYHSQRGVYGAAAQLLAQEHVPPTENPGVSVACHRARLDFKTGNYIVPIQFWRTR